MSGRRGLLARLRPYENVDAGDGPRVLGMDARRRIYLALRRAGARAGLDVVRRGIYSPIPDVWGLSDAAWDRRSAMEGLDLDLDGAVGRLGELAPFAAELRAAPPGEDGYRPDNDVYEPGEAAALYALIRHTRPRRVLELGSGQSSLLIARALAANGTGSHTICDPYPSPLLAMRPGAFTVEPALAQDLDPARFDALEAGDVLFVDTSHTVKVGGDVTRIVLEFLPRLRPGVLVHVHDVFLPYEYPRQLVRDGGLFWQEQYLLHAFLAFNHHFEVVLPLHALLRERRAALLEAFPDAHTTQPPLPSAFWFRCV